MNVAAHAFDFINSMMNLESMRKDMSSGLPQHKASASLLLDASMAAAKKEAYEKTIATLSSTALLKHQGDITLKDVVLAPQEILALFASTKQQEKGDDVHQRVLVSAAHLSALFERQVFDKRMYCVRSLE